MGLPLFGPSDRVRTCGLMVPNHPRYQLRYTRVDAARSLKERIGIILQVAPWRKCFLSRSLPRLRLLPPSPGKGRKALTVRSLP